MVVLIGNFADASQDASGQAALMSSFCLMVTMDSRKEKQAKKVEQTKVFFVFVGIVQYNICIYH